MVTCSKYKQHSSINKRKDVPSLSPSSRQRPLRPQPQSTLPANPAAPQSSASPAQVVMSPSLPHERPAAPPQQSQPNLKPSPQARCTDVWMNQDPIGEQCSPPACCVGIAVVLRCVVFMRPCLNCEDEPGIDLEVLPPPR